MTGFLDLFLIALGLSMDAFAVSISNSMCYNKLKKSEAVITSFCFGLFQALMPVIGFIAGRGFSGIVNKLDHWLALGLLGIIGGKMIFDGIKELKSPDECKLGAKFSFKLMAVQGVATSIDALAVGISFAALNINIVDAALTIGIVTFVCCVIGHFIGKKAGGALGKKAEIFGGVILVAIGIKIFIEHMWG